MKRLIILFVVLVVLALILPVTNLFIAPPENSLTKLSIEDPVFANAVSVFAEKCVNCHTEEYNLPFYASFPVAKGIVETDIQEGTRYLDLAEAVKIPPGEAVSEVMLAKTEHTLHQDSMPPLRYLLLHWNGGLDETEKDAIQNWIQKERTTHYATAGAAPKFQHEALQPLSKPEGLDPKKVALGDKIFHDTRLSGDDTISCATCHGLDKGGTDQLKFSKGIGGAVGDINAPTVFNAGFQHKQFWDGRAADLVEQADGPVNNPIEMGADWPEVIAKLQKDDQFVAAFQAVYPEGLKAEYFLDAIATFEQSLVTVNDRFDQYLMGKSDALSAEEQEGYHLFKNQGCATCHVGKILGGQSFEIMGRKKDYFEHRGNPHKPDFGRFNVTQDEKDRFKLKVPTLRNIALTFPYFHDGSTSDLSEAVHTMAEFELGKTLSAQETDRIVQFLKTLTGELNGKPL